MEEQPLLDPARRRGGRAAVLSALRRPWDGRSLPLRRDLVPWLPARAVLCLLSCLGFANVYLLRVNLSVALVQMDKDTATLRNRSARVGEYALSIWLPYSGRGYIA